MKLKRQKLILIGTEERVFNKVRVKLVTINTISKLFICYSIYYLL